MKFSELVLRTGQSVATGGSACPLPGARLGEGRFRQRLEARSLSPGPGCLGLTQRVAPRFGEPTPPLLSYPGP